MVEQDALRERLRRILLEEDAWLGDALSAQDTLKRPVHGPNLIAFTVKAEKLARLVKRLVREEGFRILSAVMEDERDRLGHVVLTVIVWQESSAYPIALAILLDGAHPTYPAITPHVPMMNWYEREHRDLFGVEPLGHPQPYALILHASAPDGVYPLSRDAVQESVLPRVPGEVTTDGFVQYEGGEVSVVPVGPIHAGIIEPGHFLFGTVGEPVVHLDVRLFYTHRGIEKMAEGLPLLDGLKIAERTCGVCTYSHGLAYSLALETLASVELPERAVVLRTILAELERMMNHIGDIGNMCAGFGYHRGVADGARLKERLLRLNERLFKHRYLRGVVRPGGLNDDLDAAGKADMEATLRAVEDDFAGLMERILKHEIAQDRLRTTGMLGAEIARDLCVVGPAARASGVPYDVRLVRPYLAYTRRDVAELLKNWHGQTVRSEGDAYARMMVRAAEVEQSLAIVRCLLKKLPDGTVHVPLPKLPAHTVGFTTIESPRGELAVWVRLDAQERLRRLKIRSATYHNWPAVPYAVAGNIIADFPLINKSFELCYACCDR
ncbi:MAG: NADH-quinone oxidoreductase subunit C [Candidatus Carbobacillus altaicus]|nr:NADH-quinone oxidoreductase subunit C [Candidatus Carbobacillus altaicus]